MRLFTALMLFGFILSSCSKEKKLANDLAGDWTVFQTRSNGEITSVEFDGSIFSFPKCLPKDEPCSATWKGQMTNGNAFDFPFTYTINSKNYLSTTFSDQVPDSIIEKFTNIDVFFIEDTLELEYISNGSFYEFLLLK